LIVSLRARELEENAISSRINSCPEYRRARFLKGNIGET
jgi:hypothetical protein